MLITGSSVWDMIGIGYAKGIIQLSENAFLLLWIIGVAGLFLSAWLLYSAFIVRYEQINKKPSEKTIPVATEVNRKKCPMCAELVMSEAKICKHCSHEFVIENK